jgi:esterase/lipase superfamily enzyme
MAELASALPGIALPVLAAACLYALIWRATRALDAAARVLARAVPAAAIVPGLLWVSPVLSIQRDEAAARRTDIGSLEQAPSRRSASRAAQTAAGAAANATPPAAAVSNADWDIVPVFYGTDRVRKSEAGRLSYGAERARRLELGRALVTVPAAHRVPAIERPFALRIPYLELVVYERAEDPKKHFTIKVLEVLPRNDLLTMVRARIAAARAFRDQVVVFIHGFNTDFDNAIYRTAQLAYDLQFDGAAFLYSWPAGAGVIGYTGDRESATQAEPYLKEFLDLVVRETGARSVSVIAHSMGSLPLLNVLRDLGPSLPPGVRLNELILAAPDVDRDVFANLVSAIRGYGRGITLYCSANDRAMVVSRQVAGGVPRAGDVPADGPVILPGVDTIDVTETSTDLLALNHSLYAEKGALLNDIGLLLQTGERPPDRRIPILQRVRTLRGDFWRYP